MSIEELTELKTLDSLHRIVEYQPLGPHVDVLMDTRIDDRTFKVSILPKDHTGGCWVLTAPMDDLFSEYSCYLEEHKEEGFEGYYYKLEITSKHKLIFSQHYDKDYFCAKELGRAIWDKLIKLGFLAEKIDA